MIDDADIAGHQAQLQRYLGATDPLQGERALEAATEQGKQLVARGALLDDLLALHQRAQGALAAQAEADADTALQRRLAGGGALPVMLALLLPHQLDEQARSARYQEGLRQADKLRAVGTLAAGIAHDFNNLLGSIIGLAEIGELQAPAGSQLSRNLAGILQAARRAADLTAQMLSFAHEQPLQLRTLDLGALLQAHRDLWAAMLPKNLPLQLELADQALVVQADAAQLEQVLLNLIRNAGDALHEAQAPCVRLVLDSAVPAGHSGRWARVQVIDKGCGIAADVLPRIFEPFFTTKNVNQGTGLGLASAHGIVTRHGGLITVRSTPGQGSCFAVWLPLASTA